MDIEALKATAREIMGAMVRDRATTNTRSNTRSTIVARLHARTDLDERARRFVGDFLMAQYGYGGGL